MPAQSKQQQKFMGIVRAIQKGDQPASKFSKKAQDAADDMKKKDVEKFASTKHKGLPKKVEQALREKIRTMVEDYVETCGYKFSATNPEYKLKSPGGTGEEDKELKENAGVPNKMRAGFKKLKNKEGLSIEERDELYKAYKSIVELMTYGNFYDNKKPNKRRKELSELTFDINYALVGSKRLGSYQGRFEKILKKFLNMINTQIKREEKGLKTDYRKAMRASKLDDVKNIFKNMTKYARTQKGIQKGTNEGFGSDESLTKTEKKKFEKERLENAEVLGYELTGVKDVNENINEKKKMFPPDKMTPKQAKEYKKFIDYAKMGIEYKIDMSLFESINEDGHTDVPSAVRKLKTSIEDALQIIGYLKKVNDAEPLPSWWTDKVTLSSNYLNTARNYILNPHESVFAVRQDKIKNGERFPKEPNFDYDPEKGKSRIRKVNEKMRPTVKKLLKQKGYGPIFQAIDNSKRQFKQMRYSRGEIQDTLIGMFGSEDPKILRKIKEEKVNEMTTSQAKDTLNHLGGKRFMVMTGAKPLTIDKKRKELLFKIGRNAKGINLVTIRLTSLDLYDMEFAQVRMGNKKVKAVEKRVYGDQLQKFFKKHTGMNTYL